MRRNLRSYGNSPSAPGPEGSPPQRGTQGDSGLRSPRFIAGTSLVLALIAVAVAIAALVLALDADSNEDVAAEVPMVGPAVYTVDVVDRAVRYYQEHGWAEAAEYYLTPWSVDGTWHVFMVNPEDRIVASQDQGLLGHSIRSLGRDYRGNSWGDIEIPESGRWVRSHAWHPVTGWPTISHTWVVRHDGFVFGSAWYE